MTIKRIINDEPVEIELTRHEELEIYHKYEKDSMIALIQDKVDFYVEYLDGHEFTEDEILEIADALEEYMIYSDDYDRVMTDLIMDRLESYVTVKEN